MNTDLTWIKSSHSDNEGGNCVEIAAASDGIHVRDSKDLQGPQLTFTRREWADFLTLTAEG
ncbi:DUF397 domain-containing protein [Streptomyces carminius]|uniref:DUF397 domain-containing protein n=1 Tax=Streptomyces carminius TaxID=2665496 RepID=A0A2M8M5S2_9ACTN|nr:DUF397 domain-containing protein [Streptomyces carminius]PJE99536.1 DUF397 domain-containing protein [Streptomyces carminius]